MFQEIVQLDYRNDLLIKTEIIEIYLKKIYNIPIQGQYTIYPFGSISNLFSLLQIDKCKGKSNNIVSILNIL